jgi:hypothetical protein
MLTAHVLAIVAMVMLIAFGGLTPVTFFLSIFGVGFCYGNNFAVYPATAVRLYGVHVLGSVYPFIMAAQTIASFAPTANGLLRDATGSNYPGLIFVLVTVVAGAIACRILSASISEERLDQEQPAAAALGKAEP